MDQNLKVELSKHGIFATSFEELYNWGRKNSVWPLTFGLACCAIEMIATTMARYDLARFGAEVFRPSPRQADLMIVSGTVTKKMAPQVVRLYNQMPEPKYVIAMGACAISGGPFRDGYNVLKGIDRFIPVDVHIPGCPPRPEALIHAFMTLQDKISAQKLTGEDRARHLQADVPSEFPVPAFGHGLEPAQNDDVFHNPFKVIRGMSNAPMPLEEVRNLLQVGIPGCLVDIVPNGSPSAQNSLLIDSEHGLEAADLLCHRLALDYCSNMTAVDWPDREKTEKVTTMQQVEGGEKAVETTIKTTIPGYLEAVYHLYSIATKQGPVVIRLRTQNRTDQVTLPSMTPVWRSAEFQEREAFDLFGIVFTGHPDLRRILMWDDFVDHPMRKDYVPEPDDDAVMLVDG